MSEISNITLEDIEIMIKVLERFIRLSKKAEKVIRSLGSMYGRRGYYPSNNFIDMLIQRTLEKKTSLEEEDFEEVSEEELDEETRRILEKIRKRRKSQ